MEKVIKHDYQGQTFYFQDSPIAQILIQEIFNDNYKIFQRGVTFVDGDVVVDIGANEGMFSIMLAKLFPNIVVISYEPVPSTFQHMLKNIEINGVTNIVPFNVGIGVPGKGTINLNKNFSGGASLMDTYDPALHEQVSVDLIGFDDIFSPNFFKARPLKSRVRLLKIDIEGGEYDALYNARLLQRVDFVVGEFHINKRLESLGRDINELGTWVGAQTNLLYYEKMKMGE